MLVPSGELLVNPRSETSTLELDEVEHLQTTVGNICAIFLANVFKLQVGSDMGNAITPVIIPQLEYELDDI